MGLFDVFRKKTAYMLSEADLRWNRFVKEVCSKELSELSNIQKPAVLCFWYDAEMHNGGHSLYFDCHESIAPQQLIAAIHEVGYKEIADNFVDAVTEGEKDDWIETDRKYGGFSPSLCECLMAYVEKNKEVIFD